MMDRKKLQKIFGIMCALMALTLGTVTVLVILPFLGGELPNGVFHRMSDGLIAIAATTKIPALLIVLFAFVLPVVLLSLATSWLLHGKSDRTVLKGEIVALAALVIVGLITAIGSKALFVHWQWLYLLILGLGTAVFVAVFVLTWLAVKRESNGDAEPAEDNRPWQTGFGIMCALMAVALGTVCWMMLVPYLGGKLANGVFLRMLTGMGRVTSSLGFHRLPTILAVLGAPAILLAAASVLLLHFKRDRWVLVGSGAALVALVLCAHFTATFSKPMFVHWQWLYILLLVLGTGAFLTVLAFTLLPILRKHCPCKICKKVATGEASDKEKLYTKIFGIMCALMAVTLCVVSVITFVPYLGGKLPNGVFQRMYDGLEFVASLNGVSGVVILLVDFVLPVALLAAAAVLLLLRKSDRHVVIGLGLAPLALIIVGRFTAIFSKPLFVHWQWLYLTLLVLGTAAFVTVLVLALLQIKGRYGQPAVVEEASVSTQPVEVAPEQPAAHAVVETEKRGVLVVGGEEVLVRYNRSFVSKLRQANDDLKGYYAELTNHALGYAKVKNRISWPCSTFNRSREKLAIVTIKGKTLYLYLAMDPQVAKQTIKGTIKDVSDKRRYQAVPTLFKVKSALSLRKAKVLLDALMQSKGIELGKPNPACDPQNYPYDTTENLVKAGLIKVRAVDGRDISEGATLKAAGFNVVGSVTAEQAHTMIADEVASTLVQVAETGAVSVRAGKKFAVNIDTLSQNFASGDVVTLDALKEKGLVPKKETAIKILARGTLDKVLTVEADAFSLDAIKMIVLVGGTAIKK